MNCPKCKDEYQGDNFCSNCGAALREKCPECGEMEAIGRAVCETELEKMESAEFEYVNKSGGLLFLLGVVLGISAFILPGALGTASAYFATGKVVNYMIGSDSRNWLY